jgi:hypothetical protein
MVANAMTGNWPTVGNLAHQIKPSFVLMGASGLRDGIIEIEKSAKENVSIETLKEAIDDFRSKCLEIINSLQDEQL